MAAAKRKVTTTEVETTGEEPVDNGKDELDQDVLRALVDIEGADEVRWQIHRISEPNSGYCGEMSSAELSHERIAAAFGPGAYRVKGIKPGGEYFKSGRVKISTIPAAPSRTSSDKELLEKMREGDMMPLLLGMMQSNTQIVTAALSANRQTSQSIPWSALLVAAPPVLESLRAFFKRDDPDDKAIEKMLKQIALLEKLRGDDNKGSSWTDIIRDAVQGLPNLVAGARASASLPVSVPAMGDPRAALSLQAGSATATATTLPEPPEAIEATPEAASMEWLRQKLNDAVTWAAANRNPELRAEVLLEEWPALVPDSLLRDMLTRDDWFEQLCAFEPRCVNYHGWFTMFRDELLKLLTEESNDGRLDPGNGS